MNERLKKMVDRYNVADSARSLGSFRQVPADAELVRETLRGRGDAFGLLVQRYRPSIVRFAFGFTYDIDEAHDVAQDVFIRAYTKLRTLQSNRPFAGWLFAIARNASIDATRRTRRMIAAPVVAPQLGPEDVALRAEDAVAVHAALDAIPARYRKVLDLYYLRGLLYREISDVLDLPIGTVKTYMARGKRRIRSHLEAIELRQIA